jgi:hypothetical protein
VIYSIFVKDDAKGRVGNGNFQRYKILDIDATEITVDELILIRVLLRGIQSLMIIIKNSQKTPPTWRRVLQWYNTNLQEESSLLELL